MEFKEIKGFESLYVASSDGLIYKMKDGKPERVLGGRSRDGSPHSYSSVCLVDETGKRHATKIHRVIAETFIPNPNNLPCVNHKDGNKRNNDVSNLEWVTYSENMKHATKTGLFEKDRRVAPERSAYAFVKGYNSLQQRYTKEVKQRIMEVFKINNRNSWYSRLYGNVIPKISEAQAVEAIFGEYGIKEVWGV